MSLKKSRNLLEDWDDDDDDEEGGGCDDDDDDDATLQLGLVGDVGVLASCCR